MIARAPVVIDTLTRVASFGLGLWDAAAGRLVAHELFVRVAPIAGGLTRAPITARANASGIFVVHSLPVDGRGSPAESLLIEVYDPLGRFLSFVLHVDVAETPRLIVPPCLAVADLTADTSPPATPAFVPLFNTASRTPPAGTAVVRTSLRDSDTGQPAALALLDVREAGRLIGRGVADDRGEVAVMFAYPEPSPLPPWSPPGRPAPPTPLTAQTWPLEVEVRYRRRLQRYRVDATRPAAPDLCELIEQPPAVLSLGGSPPASMADATLRYGQELVLAGPLGGPLVVVPA